MSTELAVREISLPVWQTILAIAPSMRGSGLFGVKNADAAAAIMLKGYELGLGLTVAFEFIHLIDDKPSLSPRGAFAIVQQSGLLEEFEIVEESTPVVKCTVTMKRRGGIKYTTSFSVDDAKTAGLVKEGGSWKKYPVNMCKWRAMGYCMDMVFADITGGMKQADEYGADLTPAGDVIEGSWTVAPVSQPTPAPAPSTANDKEFKRRFAALVSEFDDADIATANGGKPVKTIEDIDFVERYLKAQSVPFDMASVPEIDPNN